MQRKLLIFIAVLSIIGGIAFAANWLRQQQRVYRLTIATGMKGGDYYSLGDSLTRAVARNSPRIQIQPIPTSGSLENAELLDQKKVDLALVQNNVPTKPSFRSIALLYSELFHLIVAERAGIKNVSDIKGKRIAIPLKGTGSYFSFEKVLQHYNLKLNDFQHVELSPIEANLAFRQGKVDGIFRSVTLGNHQIRELLQSTKGQLVPIDQAAAMKISMPYLEEAIIPKGAYRGTPAIPDTNLPTVGVPSSLLTRKDVPTEVIREITRILFENGNDLVSENPLAATIRYPAEGKNLALPLHPGAAEYYDREKPNFLLSNADFIGLLLSVGTLAISGLWTAQRQLVEKQKNRSDGYNLQIYDLIERAQTADSLEELHGLREELFKIFKKVLEDLDKDRLSPESYQLFTFPCDVAIATLRDREVQLKSRRRQAEKMDEGGLSSKEEPV